MLKRTKRSVSKVFPVPIAQALTSYKRQMLAAMLGCGSMLMAAPALAVDLQPVQSLDSSGVGKIVAGELLAPGLFNISMHSRGDVSPIPNQVYEDTFVNDRAVMERINRQTFSFGLGLTDYLDLSISAHATSEYVGQGFKDRFEVPSADASQPWKFAGASALLKARLIKDGNFSIIFAPFVETGAGSLKAASVTRSVDPKAGWMGILNYGEEGLARLTLNAGYRYRYSEQVGQLKLRNELFYQGMAEGFLTRKLSVFAGGQGRMLKMNRIGDRDNSGDPKYTPFESSEMSVGINGQFGSTKISVYGGTRLQERAIGFGKHFAGVSLSYALGERKKSYSQRIEIAERRASKTPQVNRQPKKDSVDRATYMNQFVDKEIESFQADSVFADVYKHVPSTHEDDFRALEQRRADDFKNASTQSKLSEDELIEKELQELRLAEEKQKAAEARKQEILAQIERKNELKLMQQKQRQERQFLQELREQIDALPTIHEEEALWSGLEY